MELKKIYIFFIYNTCIMHWHWDRGIMSRYLLGDREREPEESGGREGGSLGSGNKEGGPQGHGRKM